MTKPFSMHQLFEEAAPHHTRWVRIGVLLPLVGYGVSSASILLTDPQPFPKVLTDLAACVFSAVAVALAFRGRFVAAAHMALTVVWCELHVSAAMNMEFKGAGLAVLPTFVVGAGLLSGGFGAFAVAAATAVTAPGAVLLGAWLRTGRPSLGNGDVTTALILAVALLSMAVLVHFGLRSFGAVLHESREHARRFAELVNNAPDGIVALDAAGSIASLNPAGERLLGVGADAARGGAFADVIARAGAGPATQVGALLRGEADGATVTLHGDGPDATVVELTAQHTAAADGAAATQLMLRDVTDRVRAEAERRRLEERLQQAQRLEAVGQLAGGVAHDFNNLLQAVLGYVELTRMDSDPGSPAAGHVLEIEKAARRGGDLVRQLLVFARKGMVEPQVVDLNAVTRGLDTLLRRLLPADLEYETRLAPALGMVRVDPGQFEQVLMNLVVNARDAMLQGGRLVVTTADVTIGRQEAEALGLRPGPHVRLSVADTGVGMSPEVLARIFEPFFTTKEQGRGTGLGLATCYGIVAQADGHIAVRSTLGRGTTFDIYLPRLAADQLPTAAAGDGAVAVDPGTETILVAEDDPQVRSLSARSLRGFGYRVLEASSGAEAVGASQGFAGTIHLLVTDVVMPGIGGKDLAARLRADRPGLRVLFVSGYAEDSIVHRGVLEPGLDFLAKPFAPNLLAARVREILDRG